MVNAIDKVVQATSHRAEADNGPAVVDGKLRWVSASLLTKADAQSPGGCPRAWWYRYVEHRPEPQRYGQGIGTAVHKEIEKYYETGVKELGPIALAMLEHLPPRDPMPLVEHRIGDFEVADLPVSGNADLIHEPEDGVIEVIDLKTTSSISKWAKTEEELGNTIQMLVYGFWSYLKFMPKEIRLSHVYGQSKGRPLSKKVSVALSRDEISERWWNRVEPLALQCKESATRTRAEDVEANPNACDAYGGCPHRGVCAVGKARNLEKLFGGKTMGLLDRINTKPVSADVEAEKAKLKAEEAAAKVPPEFKTAWERIMAAGKGWPALNGEAKSAWQTFQTIDFSDTPQTSGMGFLGGLTVSTVADVLQLADELHEEGMKETPPSIVPPDAPPSVHPVPEEETQKRKRGRLPKAKAENMPITPAERTETPAPEAVDLGYVPADESPSTDKLYTRSIFADCVPSCDYKPLEPYIERLCRELCEAHGCLDIRAADERGPMGYAKWKAAISAKTKANPPSGVFTVDTRSEIAFEVVSALRSMEGTFYVRSVR